jgi:hypothetical protein
MERQSSIRISDPILVKVKIFEFLYEYNVSRVREHVISFICDNSSIAK